jgi:hypothetical protein
MIPSEKIEKPMARGRVIVQSKRMDMLAKFAVVSFWCMLFENSGSNNPANK